MWRVESACFSRDGTRVLTASQTGAALWTAETGAQLLSLKGAPMKQACFSPDEKRILTGSEEGLVKLWDASTGTCDLEIKHEGAVGGIGFTPDGASIITADAKGTIRVWNAKTGEELSKFVRKNGGFYRCALAPDARVLVTSAGHSAKAWEVASGLEVFDFPCPQTQRRAEGNILFNAASFAWSNDGALLAVGCADGTVWFWDIKAQKNTATLKQHVEEVTSVCFSGTGTKLLSASRDKTCRLWDVARGMELARFSSAHPVFDADLSPDEAHVVVASLGTATIWQRRRPETVWGITYLPEFWCAVLAAVAFLYVAMRP
ncbi:MAG TPA: WD40 repeat domain-containing protein [Planctomycetota bacterium]|nr:WD40 repeat domain-containing protein [Planctomycetota bacterium]